MVEREKCYLVCVCVLFSQRGNKLMEVGERCLGEHHSHVLTRQKETISHLREKIKEDTGIQTKGRQHCFRCVCVCVY